VIAQLRGTIVEKTPNRLIVEVGGIGYDVQVPLSTFYVLGDPGTPTSLRIHTHVREDVLALYGFATAVEHTLFERLIAISGIGPKLALAVLSGIEPAELIKAIRLQNVARLTAIPGIGKKTAERIGLELKDRIPAALQAAGQDATAGTAPADQLHDDLVSALMNLGYQRPAAEKSIEKVLKDAPDMPFDHALRQVLRGLIRG
jgi:Holliday junction DNA helicase RuvA